jgi:hypothetical protein
MSIAKEVRKATRQKLSVVEDAICRIVDDKLASIQADQQQLLHQVAGQNRLGAASKLSGAELDQISKHDPKDCA